MDKTDLGPRTLTIDELPKIHSFDEPTISWLLNMPKPTALRFIAKSVPIRTLSHIWKQLHELLLQDDQASHKLQPNDQPAKEEAFISQIMATTFPTLEELSLAQQTDPVTAPIYQFVLNGRQGPEPQNAYTRYLPYLRIMNDVLFLREEASNGLITTDAVIAPTSLQKRIIHAVHTDPTMAHPGQKATYLAIASRAFWPKMRRDISRYCADCDPCIRTRHHVKTHAGLLQTQRRRDYR